MEMEKDQKIEHNFGLVGHNISYSFSEKYFSDKFINLKLKGYQYQNFDISTIDKLPNLIANNEHLKGLNVTIPYKEAVVKYLDFIDSEAAKIGAVNTIKMLPNKKLKGYNTDVYGFEHSIKPLLKGHHKKALILGTGGASKAIKYVLKKNNISVLFVSRTPKNKEEISYNDLTKSRLESHTVIINCTPIGTYPNSDECPNIPYQYLSPKHLLYDLIYNPTETLFLTKGLHKGCVISNGFKMLELQAEKSWEIWNA
tara:strand:- start:120145 stop:120909 length:765 start_codon:yes stop_codon:yes gene_type:complete